jgi:hypothetical protein
MLVGDVGEHAFSTELLYLRTRRWIQGYLSGLVSRFLASPLQDVNEFLDQFSALDMVLFFVD